MAVVELVLVPVDALAAVMHTPTFTAASVTDFSLVNVVEAEYVTAVWALVLCTCSVVPLLAAISPEAADPPPNPAVPAPLPGPPARLARTGGHGRSGGAPAGRAARAGGQRDRAGQADRADDEARTSEAGAAGER